MNLLRPIFKALGYELIRTKKFERHASRRIDQETQERLKGALGVG
jgi:hypothetical protein